jgi:hypothetical protein
MNELDSRRAARILTDAMSEDVREPIPNAGGYFIRGEKLEVITETLQAVIAEVVATLIDAGSERDAVMENDELTLAIRNELYGWTRAADENA